MTEYALTPEVLEKYRGKTVVIKYGGAAMKSDKGRRQTLEDVAALHAGGAKVVLMHGGGPEISAMLDKLGIESRFVNGLRVTDEAAMDVVQMVLSGKVNKSLAAMLSSLGAKAMGLSGVDGGLLTAEQMDPALGFVGRVTAVDTRPLETLLAGGYIPVVSSVAGDGRGQAYNVNADTAAAQIAGALGADRLFLMTDIPGVLRDKDDETSLISHIAVNEAAKLYDQGVISGGMIPKVECCVQAVRQGVARAVIMDGRPEHAIARLLLANEKIGTAVTEG